MIYQGESAQSCTSVCDKSLFQLNIGLGRIHKTQVIQLTSRFDMKLQNLMYEIYKRVTDVETRQGFNFYIFI